MTIVNIISAAGEERMTLAKLLKYFRGNGLDAAPHIAALAERGLARFVPAMRPADVGFIVSRLVALGVLIDTFGHSGYATNAYLDIAEPYRHVAGRGADQTQGLGPFLATFTADALPGAARE
ncbi:hypothetical protein H4R19_001527 [Coemansia spiralis]|nr:hypothetical protein H4R19_001527 [Coemansia spiralis]